MVVGDPKGGFLSSKLWTGIGKKGNFEVILLSFPYKIFRIRVPFDVLGSLLTFFLFLYCRSYKTFSRFVSRLTV